jgi:hypothetical protein
VFCGGGAGREDVGWHGSGAGFDDEVEAVGEERAEHELDVVRRCPGRDFGADVVVIALQPGGTSMHIGDIDAVGGGDEFGHGRLGEEIPVALDGVAVHKGVGGERAGVYVDDDEGLGGGRALSERRDGEQREKGENCPHEINLRVTQIE